MLKKYIVTDNTCQNGFTQHHDMKVGEMIKEMGKIKKYWVEGLVIFGLLLSIWAICSAQLNINPQAETDTVTDNSTRLNNAIVNISFSYIAGLIIYLLTCTFPHYQSSRRLKPTIVAKVKRIVRSIDDVVLEFSRGVNTPTRTDIKDLQVILHSKVWTDTIPMLQQVNRVNIDYISYYNLVTKSVKEQTESLIQTYKEYLTVDQISALEHWITNQSFRDASFWSSIPNKNLESPDGKKFLVDSFCKMYEEMKQIESMICG